ncbi:heme/hemin ABC transporter substrate-binding protein [Devosia sp. CN2-171]|uniref:heme/hemin ABC transporter substrate-binding protein n=1 Tax=Devosia sp. CN2-171 TaxID=3400909 RepID=UPI003BF92038
MTSIFRKPLLAAAILAASLTAAVAQEVKPFADTSRLVSIGGSLTEIIYALGEEGRLVARDQTAVYPEAATKLPDVGYMRQLAPEGVLSVNPTALLIIEGSGPKETLDVLTKGSVEIVTVPEGFSHEGILEKVHVVGKALGVDAKAAELATRLDAELKSAEAITANLPERKRILFILSMQDGKVMASGTDTAADGIIKLAGGVNAVEGYSGYKALTDEAIVTAKPDVILMMSREGGHAVTDEVLFAQAGIAMTPAAANKAVVRVDGAYALGFGPRTASAIAELATALYGQHPAAQ